MNGHFDAAVVGAGILGLAHAYALARRGQRVLVLERDTQAQGASVRNFGMIWPIGQPRGQRYDLAMLSRNLWLDLLQTSGLWFDPCGSLHLAYHDDEWQVLREFAATALEGRVLLTPKEVTARYPNIVPTNLRGGLWSPTETTVDPRQVVRELPNYLERTFGVTFVWNCRVVEITGRQVRTVQGAWSVDRVVVCTGVDFRDLLPEEFADCGLVPCKLQMMRSQAYGSSLRLGAMFAAGLTLCHYPAFADCPTLPTVARRLDHELPLYRQFGIHVLVAQNALGEVILGDSHEYGPDIDPFDKPVIDELVLDYLKRFLHLPDLEIRARWHGIYCKHPNQPYVRRRRDEHILAVTGVGGAGMTLSMGLAEQAIATWLGESRD